MILHKSLLSGKYFEQRKNVVKKTFSCIIVVAFQHIFFCEAKKFCAEMLKNIKVEELSKNSKDY